MRKHPHWGLLPALLLALCLFLLPTKAEAATVDDLTYTVSNGEVTITDCDTAATGEMVIPSTIDGNQVKAIATAAFAYCDYLTSVTIPDSVTLVEGYAFYTCKNLNSVIIGNSVTTIGERAFYYCDKLTSVTIGSSVVSIGDRAFLFCYSLTDVYYSGTEEQWAEINIGTRNDALNLATIHCAESAAKLSGICIHTVPNKVEYIVGESLDTTGLTLMAAYSDGSSKNVTNGYTVTGFSTTTTGIKYITVSYMGFTATFSVRVVYGGSCGDNLVWTLDDDGTLTISGSGVMTDYYYKSSPWYSWRDNIKKVVVEDGVTTLSRRAFSDCVNLTCVDFSSTLTTFLEGVLSGCTSLESVTIPSSVTDLGASAFADCTSLVNVTLPEALTQIEYATFVDCDSLTAVTIPSSVTTIGVAAFQNCDRLTNITIPDSVTAIYNGAFSGCKSLSSVTIGKGVSQIGANAFKNCVGLTHITIPGNVATFDHSVFTGCTGLAEVIIESGVTAIGKWSFGNCTSLVGITIPDSVTEIGEYAFYDCDSLTSITIPYSVTEIGEYAFCDCDSLASIAIPANVATIGDYAFMDCNSMTGIWVDKNNPSYSSDESGVLFNTTNTRLLQAPCKLAGNYVVPGDVTSIDNYAFYNCDIMTGITIPESVTEIGYYAFSGCKKLVSVTIPDSVTCIDEATFEYCYNLTDVTIPNTVSMIGSAAFFYCTELSSVTMGNGVNTIHEYAFHNCTSLTDVYYSGTETQWAEISIGNNNENLINALIHYTEPVVLTGVSISAMPNKVIYNTAEMLDTTGLTLTLTYNDGSTATVTEGFTVTGFDSTTPGTKILTVIYEGVTATFDVTVKEPILFEIVNQPADVEVAAGVTACFAVEANGAVSYRWQYRRNAESGWKNTTLSGCNTAALSVAMTTGRNGYQYRCVITCGDGTVLYSEPATLTMDAKLEITSAPSDCTAMEGSFAPFTVEATDVLAYRWYYRRSETDSWHATAMSGYVTDTLKVLVLPNRDGYQYRCKITGLDGTITYTEPATLHVTPVILMQPTNKAGAIGETVTFTTDVKNVTAIQWLYRRGAEGGWSPTSMEGNQTDTLYVPVTTGRAGYRYMAKLTNTDGSILYTNEVTLYLVPTVILQPADVAVAAGEIATFTVKATDALSYRWEYSRNGTTWSNTSADGYKTATLNVAAKATNNGYRYRCKITGVEGSVTYTDPAILTVAE